MKFSACDFVRLISATKSSFIFQSVVLKLGFVSSVFVSSALVNAYCESERMKDAQKLFDEMPVRNSVVYNSLIRGYSLAGSPETSMKIFKEMTASGVNQTPFTVSALLLAGGSICSSVHGVAIKRGFCSNVVVGSSILDTYVKDWGSIDVAKKLFDEMPERNLITYTSLIIGYASRQRDGEAMELLSEMQLAGLKPNEVTFSGLLAAFSRSRDVIYGMRIHCLVIRLGMDSDPFVSSSLMIMYARHGGVSEFTNSVVSDNDADQVLRNSVISGNAQLGNFKQAVEEFVRMKRRAVVSDFHTFGSLVRAAGAGSALAEGKQFHAEAIKTGLAIGAFVENGLVSMYARCGEMADSERAFTAVADPDIVTWNSLLSACAMHGHAGRALELFLTMQKQGIKPDQTTFLTLISACGHGGLVVEGAELVSAMSRPANEEHYSAIIDLLARAGRFDEADLLLRAKPSPSGFRSLATAAKAVGDVTTAARAASAALELGQDSSSFVLVSNLLADMDSWDGSASVRKKMKEQGLKKEPGWSLIE